MVLEKGAAWKTLDLDLFVLSPDVLKAALEGCPELSSLKVYFDAPIKQLVSLASPFTLWPMWLC